MHFSYLHYKHFSQCAFPPGTTLIPFQILDSTSNIPPNFHFKIGFHPKHSTTIPFKNFEFQNDSRKFVKEILNIISDSMFFNDFTNDSISNLGFHPNDSTKIPFENWVPPQRFHEHSRVEPKRFQGGGTKMHTMSSLIT